MTASVIPAAPNTADQERPSTNKSEEYAIISGITKSPPANLKAVTADGSGAAPATPAPAKAASAIGGVTFDVCDN